MSIATEITRLDNAKSAIKTAIEGKGVTVPSATTLDGYSTLIDDIECGTGSELVDNPDYFYAECVDMVTKIVALRNEHTFVMYFVTDSHVYTSSDNLQYLDAQLASMYAVAKMIKPDLVVHGGDMTNGSEAKATTIAFTDHIVACMREIGGSNTHILIGNHDGNTVQSTLDNEAQRITEAEMLTMYRSWEDGFTYAGNSYQGGQFYGYKDYANIGLRVIRLHSYREKIGDRAYDGGQGQNWGYYDDEVSWFTNVALNTDNAILIICHQTLSPILQGYPEAQNIPYNGTQMQQALDNWIDADTDHRCAGVIHGHVHWDFSAKGKGTHTVIDHTSKEEISRTGTYGDFYEHGQCLANYLTSFGTTDSTPVSSYRDVPVGSIFRGRTARTTSQGLWTAVIVDTQTETINLVRFGAGDDRAYSYGNSGIAVTGVTLSAVSGTLEEGNTVSLTATVAPADATIKSVTWSSSDTSVATVSGGLVHAVGAGTATITVRTVDGGYTASYALTVTAKPKTNWLLLAENEDGTPYNNGQGWKSGYRLGSSGAESASSTNQVTGFIPITKGQKITLSGIELPATNYTGYNTCYIAAYDSSHTCIKSSYSKDVYAQTANAPKSADSNNHIQTLTLNTGVSVTFDNMAYIRISTLSIGSDAAIYID